MCDARRMSPKFVCTVLPIALSLSACATSYQPRGWSGGYDDFDLGNGRFEVVFNGNGYTHSSVIHQYALRRAKEVCLENGFAAHQILSANAGGQTYTVGSSSSNCSFDAQTNAFGSVSGTTRCQTQEPSQVFKAQSRVLVQCVAPAPPGEAKIEVISNDE